MFKERLEIYLELILIIIIAVICIVYVYNKQKTCENNGGLYVRSAFGYTCYKGSDSK